MNSNNDERDLSPHLIRLDIPAQLFRKRMTTNDFGQNRNVLGIGHYLTMSAVHLSS